MYSNSRKRKANWTSGHSAASKIQKVWRRRRAPQTNVALHEVKYYETYVTDGSMITTPVVACLNTIGEGDDYNNRNGRQILHKYCQYNFVVRGVVGSSNQPERFDVYIVLDRQPNGTAAVYSDMFDSSIIASPYAMKNIKSNQDRFRFMAHHTGIIACQCVQDASVKGYVDFTKLDLKDRTSRFVSTSAAVPTQGAVYLVYMSSSGSASVISMFGGFRYCFTE